MSLIILPEYIVPSSFSKYVGLIALQSTRKGGVSTGAYSSLNLGNNTGDDPELVHQNTLRLCHAAGINPERMVSSIQIHGTEILYAEKPGQYDGYDAFITNKKNLFLCIFTADCFPVLLYDPLNHALGAVHSGWKGSSEKIVMKTVKAMERNFNSIPAQCLAFIGTGISSVAYEVGCEIAMKFDTDFFRILPTRQNEKKYQLDLGGVNYQQLVASGIPASNIEYSPFCSYRNSELFFSHRRDNSKTGRMVSLIGMISDCHTE
ncbi:MAG: peptidoglycan editing factor PgeF [Chlorobiaceae bacterium]